MTPESSGPEEIEEVARQLALSVIFWTSGLPGRLWLGGGTVVNSPTGECWVVDGAAFDKLDSLLARTSSPAAEEPGDQYEQVETIRRAFERVRERIVFEGVFDEYDEDAEQEQGKRYAIDGAAFPDFRSLFVPLTEGQGQSERKPDRQKLEELLGEEPSALARYAQFADYQRDMCLDWIAGAPTPVLREQRIHRVARHLGSMSLDPFYEIGTDLMFPELRDLYGPPRLLSHLSPPEQAQAVREARVLGAYRYRQYDDAGVTFFLAGPDDDLTDDFFLVYPRPCVLNEDTVGWMNRTPWETMQEAWDYFDLPEGDRAPGPPPAEPLWVSDPTAGETLAESARHTGPVLAVACAGDRAVSASADGTLRVWDAVKGQSLHVLTGHTADVGAVALTEDGIVISASNDGTLRMWDVETGELRAVMEGYGGVETNALALTPDGKRAITATADGVRIWTIAPEPTGLRLILRGHIGPVLDVAATPEWSEAKSRRVVSASADGTLWVWDLTQSPGVPGLATIVSADGTVRLWQMGTEPVLRALSGHTGAVLAVKVALTSDGERAVSASADGTLRVWNLATGRTRTILAGHSAEVRALAVMPEEYRIVSGSADGTLRVWHLNGGLYHTLAGHSQAVTGVVVARRGWGERLVYLSPGSLVLVRGVPVPSDGTGVISASADGTLRLWDLNTGRNLLVVEGAVPFTCCAIDPNGQTLVAGDEHGQVHFLRLRAD